MEHNNAKTIYTVDADKYEKVTSSNESLNHNHQLQDL